MDSFEFNKWIGAFLGTVFVVFSVGIISDSIFAAPHPEKEGFIIEAAEPEAEHWRRGRSDRGADRRAARLPPIRPPAKPCTRSASPATPTEKGGPNKVGPNLWGIVNRPIASHEGFAYSTPMKEFSQGGSVVWDYDHLEPFPDLAQGPGEGHRDGLRRRQEARRTRQPDRLSAYAGRHTGAAARSAGSGSRTGLGSGRGCSACPACRAG